MTETQKRIKAYQKALPHMKERVTAVALLFVMSITMMASATFAWVTLSRNPEISGLATTIATNGNLEIALSDIDGLAPDETKIGDGSGNITESNLTWGNLVNLSDASYGLSNITLRPASLNTRTLATNPMYTVDYSADGRISGYFNDFSYTNYNGTAFIPESTQKYGVRAISTVTYGDIYGDELIRKKIDDLNSDFRDAQEAFESIYNIENSSKAVGYMSTVGGLVGVHVDYTLNGGSPECSAYMENLYKLACDFRSTMQNIGELIADTANVYLFYYNRNAYNSEDIGPYDFDDLIEGRLTEASLWELCKQGTSGASEIEIPSLEYFMEAWRKFAGYDCVIKEYSSLPSYSSNYVDPTTNSKSIYGAFEVIETKWNAYEASVLAGSPVAVTWDSWMRMAVNQMCDMDSATIRANNGKDYTPSELVQLKSDMNIGELLPFANSNNSFHATIHAGAIKDADQLLQSGMYVPSNDNVRIQATVSAAGMALDIKMKPSISTAIDDEPAVDVDIIEAQEATSGESNYKGDATAAETYAMVMDFWVRTNAEQSLLILEGESIYEQKTGTDENGNSVGKLYSWATTNEDNETVTVLVYENEGKYYYEGTSEQTETTPKEANLTVVNEDKPSSYEGSNRVWQELDEEGNIYQVQMPAGAISTTQGSGSCYVFYPASPEDQEQSLKLLSAMRVAFVDDEGNLLARADMDPDSAVEDSGRVLVPLKLRINTPIEIDESGITESYYITPLVQNEPKRITAIVYLDGTNLTNSDVLSAGSITGQLNIQFSTTDMDIEAAEDKEVMSDYYSFEFSPTTKEFAETDTDWSLDLSLTLLSGTQPTSVKGNFVSVINSTQGASQPQFTMTRNGDTNEWNTSITFTGPGNYQLRSIQIDGVDYLLDKDKIVKVKVPGTSVTSLGWDVDKNTKSVLTADTVYQQELSLVLNSSASTFQSVQGVFIGDNGQNATVNFTTKDGTNYSGSASFNASGTYKLTYVYIDGVITSLVESDADGNTVKDLSKTLTLQLGLTTEINIYKPQILGGIVDETILKDINGTIVSGWSFIYTCAEPLTLDATCMLYDDQGNQITGLDNVGLYYKSGSVTNALFAKMTWDSDIGKYTGTFLFDGSGNFTFQNVEVVTNGTKNYVTKATVSPEITAIPPVPMEYVEQPEYADVTYDLSMTADDRALKVTLANASAAKLSGTLIDANGNETSFSGISASTTDNGVSTFKITVPSDGEWTLNTLYAEQVFYNDVYYSGGDNVLDLSEVVQAGDISTYFLTEANVTVLGAPSTSYSGAFMQDHEVNDMVISVTSNGQPLAKLLADLNAEYPNANLDQTVSVNMKYTWGGESGYEIIGDDSNLPTHDFGGDLTLGSDYTFRMGDMNFKLAGLYTPTFSVNISGKTYDANSKYVAVSTTVKEEISVSWMAPDVKFTATDPSVGTKFTTTEGQLSNSIDSTGYALTAYFKYVAADGCDNFFADYYPSTATAVLTQGGAFESATLTISGNENMVYTFSPSTGNSSATTEVGSGGNNTARNTVGSGTASSITLEFNGVSYILTLYHSLTVTNPA